MTPARWSSAKFLSIVMMIVSTRVGNGLQVRDRDPEWVAPPKAASKPNPLVRQAAAESGGRKIFGQRCAACHADDGAGTTKAPDLTAPDVQSQTDGALFWKISSGNTRGGMPSFSFLPEAQRWQIVLRLRSLAIQTSAQ